MNSLKISVNWSRRFKEEHLNRRSRFFSAYARLEQIHKKVNKKLEFERGSAQAQRS